MPTSQYNRKDCHREYEGKEKGVESFVINIHVRKHLTHMVGRAGFGVAI